MCVKYVRKCHGGATKKRGEGGKGLRRRTNAAEK